MMMDKIDSLNETLKERRNFMERAITSLDRTDRETALAVVMAWMSTDRLREMVEFWEAGTK